MDDKIVSGSYFQANKIKIGQRIKLRRKELKMTQKQLGDSLWLNKSTIQRYENGLIDNIKFPIIHAIAKQLDVDPYWLLLINDNQGKFVERYDGEEYNNISLNKVEDRFFRKLTCIDYSLYIDRDSTTQEVMEYKIVAKNGKGSEIKITEQELIEINQRADQFLKFLLTEIKNKDKSVDKNVPKNE